MKLNLGCGSVKIPNYINVDKVKEANPDEIWNLETFPWPWEDNSAEEVLLSHVLEHLGRDTDTFMKIIQELYRVCKKDALINIFVPHPRHDDFIGDPTHVRPIMIGTLELLSKKNCKKFIETNAANTPLADYWDVDFEIVRANVQKLDDYWADQMKKGMKNEEFQGAVRSFNNVIKSLFFQLKAVK